MNKVFKQNPNLEKYFATSDGENFYNENDAKNYAKNLKDKTVKTVLNENFIEVEGSEELSDEGNEMAAFEADQKLAEEKKAQEEADQKLEADKKAQEEADQKLAEEKKAQEEADQKLTDGVKTPVVDLAIMTKKQLLAYALEQKLTIANPKATNPVLVTEITNQLNSQK